MLEKYLQQTEFTDFEDFKANYKLLVPENFNFGYDIVDAWAAKEPTKKPYFGQMIKANVENLLLVK